MNGHSAHTSESTPPYTHEQGYPDFLQHSDLHYPPQYGYHYPNPHGHTMSFVPPETSSPFSPSGTPIRAEDPQFLETSQSNPGNYHEGFNHSAGHSESAKATHLVLQDDQSSPNSTHAAEMHSNGKICNGSSGTDANGASYDGQIRPRLKVEPVLQYLLSQFGSLALADYIVKLRHVNARFEPVEIPVHGLLIAQSPFLQTLMEETADEVCPKPLVVETADRFLTAHAFSAALKTVYGAPLYAFDNFQRVLGSPTSQSETSEQDAKAQDGMEVAVAYASAGQLLQLNSVAQHGKDMATRMISWETLEHTLAFAIDGGLDDEWAVKDTRSAANESSRSGSRRPSYITEQSEPSSASTTDLASPWEPSNGFSAPTSQPTYSSLGNNLLHEALDFIIFNFPPNFTLDSRVPDMTMHSRLPSIAEQSPRLNPQLSAIQFGDYESDDPSPNSMSTLALSKVLLSLPFPLLKHILESPQLGSAQGWASASLRQKTARAVIDNREKRRVRVLRSQSVSFAERAAHEHDWEPVGWKESVVVTYGGAADGVELTRRWRGFRDPQDSRAQRG